MSFHLQRTATSASFTSSSTHRAPDVQRSASVHLDDSAVLDGKTRALSAPRLKRQLSRTVTGLLSFAGGVQIDDKDQFKAEVEQVRRRLNTVARFTINPRSRFLQIWDTVTIGALLFTTFVTPFEIAFFVEELGYGDFSSAPFNFAFNRLVDAIFMIDIVVHFFLPFRASLREGGMMVYNNARIVRAYLRGWFAIDFITCLPLDMVVLSFLRAGTSGGDTAAIDPNSFRLLRMLRIMKLMRVIRASRIINRWQDHVTISFATLSLFNFIFLTVLLAHWLACLWGFTAMIAAPEPTDGPVEWHSFDQGLTWRHRALVGDDAGPFDLYGVSLHVAFSNIFGGSSEVSPGNYVRSSSRTLELG